jgi:hypothetical protein
LALLLIGFAGGDVTGVLLKRSTHIFLWLGAPLLIVAVILFVQWARKRFRDDPGGGAVCFALLAAAVVSVFYVFVYVFVGRDGYGFVKYHAPVVPLLALAFARLLPLRGPRSVIAALSGERGLGGPPYAAGGYESAGPAGAIDKN